MKSRRGEIVTGIVIAISMIGLIAGGIGFAAASGDGEKSQPLNTPTATVLPTVAIPMDEWTDTDGDGISNRLEVNFYRTDPLKADTDGDGINDYNELFIYPDYLDPLDANDAQAFISMLPNVTANYTDWVNGGSLGNNSKRVLYASLSDPLVRWYSDHTSIVWSGTSGALKIDGEKFSQGYALNVIPTGALMTPAYYFTHGRIGDCQDSAEAVYTVMRIKGTQCLLVRGTVNGGLHAWVEVKIEDTIYVINYNCVVPADEFYLANPNWTIEKRYMQEDPYTNVSW